MSHETAPRWLLDIRSYWATLTAEQEEQRRRAGAAARDPLETPGTDSSPTGLALARPLSLEVGHAPDEV